MHAKSRYIDLRLLFLLRKKVKKHTVLCFIIVTRDEVEDSSAEEIRVF